MGNKGFEWENGILTASFCLLPTNTIWQRDLEALGPHCSVWDFPRFQAQGWEQEEGPGAGRKRAKGTEPTTIPSHAFLPSDLSLGLRVVPTMCSTEVLAYPLSLSNKTNSTALPTSGLTVEMKCSVNSMDVKCYSGSSQHIWGMGLSSYRNCLVKCFILLFKNLIYYLVTLFSTL